MPTSYQYPLPNFSFMVEWGGANTGFQEVTGLEMELQVLEYRDGSAPEYTNRKLPGLHSYRNVILRRGVTKGDYDCYNWINTVQLSNIDRREVTIMLMDDKKTPTFIWKLSNAWPCRLSYSPLNGQNGQVMMEEIELVHEGMTVKNN
jgi:phage tail-like protein